jgi:chromatin remodeling complex protein RSC6
VQPDAALAAVVGKDPLPRTELTKRLWEYVRKHELQDPKDKRSIRADEKLLAVFIGNGRASLPERLDDSGNLERVPSLFQKSMELVKNIESVIFILL